jgi:hypothetical protein
MKDFAVAMVVILVLASGGLGFYLGATNHGVAPNDSSSTTIASGGIPAYQLSILNANWTVYPSAGSGSCYVSSPSQRSVSRSGSCSLSSLSFVSPGTGEYHPGPPVTGGTFPMGPGESGSVVMTVRNTGSNANVVFDTVTSSPYEAFFANSQGCQDFAATGFCGYAAGDSNTTFTFTFLSVPGTYKPMNVTFDVAVAVLASS